MFRRKTVFILGAGASWHYGYPTGQNLVHLVIDQARELAVFCETSSVFANAFLPSLIKLNGEVPDNVLREQWQSLKGQALELAARLEQVNPTLIDYFLAQNSELQTIGKLVIAMVILRCEQDFGITRRNPNRAQSETGPVTKSGDDWLRFVLYKLTSFCDESADLLKNQVSFITFNYDTSLERRLLRGLENISRFDKADIAKFFSVPRIIHVYGQICETLKAPLVVNFPLPRTLRRDIDGDERIRAQATINNCLSASSGIFTIDGTEKERTAILEAARKAIAEAEVIYILGYGFDDSNNRRLSLRSAFEQFSHSRSIMFTNLGGLARVSKASSRLMFGEPNSFMDKKIHEKRPMLSGNSTPFYWEMSAKNCYDALAEDFESLEE